MCPAASDTTLLGGRNLFQKRSTNIEGVAGREIGVDTISLLLHWIYKEVWGTTRERAASDLFKFETLSLQG